MKCFHANWNKDDFYLINLNQATRNTKKIIVMFYDKRRFATDFVRFSSCCYETNKSGNSRAVARDRQTKALAIPNNFE